jgi:hypothetical protein
VNAKRRIAYIHSLLAEIGLEEGRLRMFQMSSAQAAQFAEAAQQMAEQIEALGPTPLWKSIELKENNQSEENQLNTPDSPIKGKEEHVS